MFEDIKAIQKTNKQTAILLKQLRSSGLFETNNEAFVILRACLKALRDRLPPDEVLHLASQLPALLKGYYFEGWKINREQKPLSGGKHPVDFIEDVRAHLHGHDQIDLFAAVPVALKVILDAIDQGEAIQVLHCLPKEIKELFPE